MIRFARLSDESLIAFHDSVRKQVAADIRLGDRFRLVGDGTRQYTSDLQAEMKRRDLKFTPIDWTS